MHIQEALAYEKRLWTHPVISGIDVVNSEGDSIAFTQRRICGERQHAVGPQRCPADRDLCKPVTLEVVKIWGPRPHRKNVVHNFVVPGPNPSNMKSARPLLVSVHSTGGREIV